MTKRANGPRRAVSLMSPERRTPFFAVGDELFLDLCWNWGHPLEVPPDVLFRYLDGAASGHVIIGRRLERGERDLLLVGRRDGEAEIYAQLVRRDQDRWRRRRR